MRNKIISAFLYSLFIALIYGSLFIFYYIILKPEYLSGVFYAVIYSYGHGFEFAFFVLVICIVTVWMPKYIRMFFWLAPAFVLLLYFAIDITVFKQFKYNMTFSMLQLFLGPASKEIFNFSTLMYVEIACIVAFLLSVIFACYLLACKLADRRGGVNKKFIVVPFVAMIMCVLSYHGIHAYANHKNYLPVMQAAYILPQSYPLSLRSLLASYGIESADNHVENVTIKNMNYPLSFPDVGDNASEYNIVLIMIDSWRADCMNEEITPNIYKFAEKSILFLNHNANANQTRSGLFSIFYGILGNYWDAALYSGTSPVFMDMLQKENYRLGIFASSALTSPEFDRTIFSKVPDLRIKTDAYSANARDLKITDEFIEFLDNMTDDKPFFGFLFYDSPHAYSFNEEIYPAKFKPYSAGRNYINVSDDDREKLFNLYKNSVGYTDVLIGRVIDELTKRNLLDNTVVVITGDHGEEFNDLGKGYWGHMGNYSIYQTQVPFILKIPDMEPEIVEYETSHMDFVPTMMKYVFDSRSDTRDYSMGYDLLNPAERPYIFIRGEEYALKHNGKYMIMKRYGLPEVRDAQYNLLDETPDALLIGEVLRQLKLFRK